MDSSSHNDDSAGRQGGVPSAAGIYDYLLGGTSWTEADRQAGDALNALNPDYPLREIAWINRGFLQRAARWLTTTAGVDQIIDLGAGLPTVHNTHEIVTAGTRVVYLDHDPAAVERGQSLLAETGTGDAAYLRGDIRDPELLDHPELRRVIDLDRPVGLLLIGLLYFIPDDADPWGMVARLVDRLAPGSYLALSHNISDHFAPERVETTAAAYGRASDHQVHPRPSADVKRFFDGLEIVPPYQGAAARLDYIALWGAEDPVAADDDPGRAFVAAVARKP